MAMYKANPQPIVKKEHAPRGTAGVKKVRSSCLHHRSGRATDMQCLGVAEQARPHR